MFEERAPIEFFAQSLKNLFAKQDHLCDEEQVEPSIIDGSAPSESSEDRLTVLPGGIVQLTDIKNSCKISVISLKNPE